MVWPPTRTLPWDTALWSFGAATLAAGGDLSPPLSGESPANATVAEVSASNRHGNTRLLFTGSPWFDVDKAGPTYPDTVATGRTYSCGQRFQTRARVTPPRG